jgi:hypothetical protein
MSHHHDHEEGWDEYQSPALYQCQRAPCGLSDCVHATPHEHSDRCDREGGRCGKCLRLPQNRPQEPRNDQTRTREPGER